MIDDPRGNRERPGESHKQVDEDGQIVKAGIVITEVVPEELVLGAFLKESPVVFLNNWIFTRSQ